MGEFYWSSIEVNSRLFPYKAKVCESDIELTMKIKNNRSLHFLDVLVIRLWNCFIILFWNDRFGHSVYVSEHTEAYLHAIS